MNFSVLRPALTAIPFARALFELENSRPFGRTIVIVLNGAAFLAAVSVNDSFGLPFATPESEACDAEAEVRTSSAMPGLGGDALSGTVVAGDVGLNVTSCPLLSTAVHWLTDGHATLSTAVLSIGVGVGPPAAVGLNVSS